MGDSVVPHTPVLQECKHLAMAGQCGAQTLPSTPGDQPTNVVPQLAESSLATVTVHVSGTCVSVGAWVCAYRSSGKTFWIPMWRNACLG